MLSRDCSEGDAGGSMDWSGRLVFLVAGRSRKLVGVCAKGNQAGQPMQSLRDKTTQCFRVDHLCNCLHEILGA